MAGCVWYIVSIMKYYSFLIHYKNTFLTCIYDGWQETRYSHLIIRVFLCAKMDSIYLSVQSIHAFFFVSVTVLPKYLAEETSKITWKYLWISCKHLPESESWSLGHRINSEVSTFLSFLPFSPFNSNLLRSKFLNGNLEETSFMVCNLFHFKGMTTSPKSRYMILVCMCCNKLLKT